MSVTDACKHVGVSTVTHFRWKQQSEFADYLAALISSFDQEALHRLYSLKFAAVERLAALLDHSSAAVSLRAAEAILNRTEANFESAYQPIPMLQTAVSWAAVQKELERISKGSEKPCEMSE